MRNNKDVVRIGLVMLFFALVLNGIHYMIFRDLNYIMMYMLAAIAFIPLELFLMTVVIDRLMEGRERERLMVKLNMLIGLFFQELGTDILRQCASADAQIASLREKCHVTGRWKEAEFNELDELFRKLQYVVEIDRMDLGQLYQQLDRRKEMMISLIANPSLLEHETFSNLLMAVSHLHEELAMRDALNQEDTSRRDSEHLALDTQRAYRLLAVEWLQYMKHLKNIYPYLFATAMINNPFENRKRTEMEREVREQLYDPT